jgi:hypothetical protein
MTAQLPIRRPARPKNARGGPKLFDDQDERAFLTQGGVMFISMVEEPTKMLRGALAFFRGASCSVKSRDPIGV